MPAKRKNTGKRSNGNAKQAKQDGQKAVSHEINVPIDEGFKEGKLWPVSNTNWQACTSNRVTDVSSTMPLNDADRLLM